MTAFDAAIEDLHADEDFSVAASYRRPPFTWQSVRVILSQPTDILGSARAGTLQAEIRSAAITDVPERGDELRIDGTTYKVEDTERDVQGLSWKLTLSQPAAE